MKRSTITTSFLLLTLLTIASCSNSSNDGAATATQEDQIATLSEYQGHWNVLYLNEFRMMSDSELNEEILEIEKSINEKQEENPLYSYYYRTAYLSKNKIISLYGSPLGGGSLIYEAKTYEVTGKNSFTTQFKEGSDEPIIVSHEIIRFDGKRLIIMSYPSEGEWLDDADRFIGIYERVTEEQATKILNTDQDPAELIDRLTRVDELKE